MPMDVVSLSKISGHRDLRMLARYSHLCAGELAERLDEAREIAEKRRKARKAKSKAVAPSRTDTSASVAIDANHDEEPDDGEVDGNASARLM